MVTVPPGWTLVRSSCTESERPSWVAVSLVPPVGPGVTKGAVVVWVPPPVVPGVAICADAVEASAAEDRPADAGPSRTATTMATSFNDTAATEIDTPTHAGPLPPANRHRGRGGGLRHTYGCGGGRHRG